MNFNELFPNISKSCKDCDTCCKTYGWLLKKEARKFIEKGIPVMKLNNSLFCIDSFKKDKKGNLVLEKIPRCRFYWKRECLMQNNKPLDCKLFPIKIKFYDSFCILGLSLGCKYVSNLNKKEKEFLYRRIIKFAKEMPKKELDDYLNLMQKVSLISKPKRFWMTNLIKFKKQGNSWNIINFFS